MLPMLMLHQWIRRLQLFDLEDIDDEFDTLEGQALEDAWQKWIDCEQKRRYVQSYLKYLISCSQHQS